MQVLLSRNLYLIYKRSAEMFVSVSYSFEAGIANAILN